MLKESHNNNFNLERKNKGIIMENYVQKSKKVRAIQWFPNPDVGIGNDRYGVEYTVTEYAIQTSKGSIKITPGDYLIFESGGRIYPISQTEFRKDFVKV